MFRRGWKNQSETTALMEFSSGEVGMVLLLRPLAGGAKEVFAFACLVAGDLCAIFTLAHCPVLDPGIRTVAQSRKWCFLADCSHVF